MKEINIEGIYYDFDKLEELKKYWFDAGNGVLICTLHNAIFNANDQPCWDCWDSCAIKI